MRRMSILLTIIVILITVVAVKGAAASVEPTGARHARPVAASAPHDGNAKALEKAAGETSEREHTSESAGEGEHGEGEHGGAVSWWRFTGWESVFTILAGLYFGLAIQILPRFLAEPSTEKEHH